MTRFHRPLLAAVAIAGAIAALAPTADAAKLPKTQKYSADVAVQWMDLLYDRVKAEGIAPPAAARIYGYAGVALYVAVEPGMSKTHRSLQGQLNELAAGTIAKPNKNKPLHWPSVANTTLHDVLVSLFAAFPNSVTEFDTLRDTLGNEYQAAISDKTFARSETRGALVATALIAWIATDGFAAQSACPAYVVGSDPADWQPTPPGFSNSPALPCWGQMRTFVLATADELPLDPFPTFDVTNQSLFYAQALEVLASKPTGGSDEEAIALFWADNPTATGTPPGHWMDTVRQFCVAEDLNLAEAAECFARAGIAVHDAFVATWHYKYLYDLMRPVTYIIANIDNGWLPLLTTPNFPEYPSGHSTQSGAAVIMLEDAFGFAVSYTDTIITDQNPLVGVLDRSFVSFDEAGREAMLSRLYGGIHFRAGNEDGYALGQDIGRLIRASVEFRKGEDS
jgi:hypothetical protein